MQAESYKENVSPFSELKRISATRKLGASGWLKGRKRPFLLIASRNKTENATNSAAINGRSGTDDGSDSGSGDSDIDSNGDRDRGNGNGGSQQQ